MAVATLLLLLAVSAEAACLEDSDCVVAAASCLAARAGEPATDYRCFAVGDADSTRAAQLRVATCELQGAELEQTQLEECKVIHSFQFDSF